MGGARQPSGRFDPSRRALSNSVTPAPLLLSQLYPVTHGAGDRCHTRWRDVTCVCSVWTDDFASRGRCGDCPWGGGQIHHTNAAIIKLMRNCEELYSLRACLLLSPDPNILPLVVPHIAWSLGTERRDLVREIVGRPSRPGLAAETARRRHALQSGHRTDGASSARWHRARVTAAGPTRWPRRCAAGSGPKCRRCVGKLRVFPASEAAPQPLRARWVARRLLWSVKGRPAPKLRA